MMERLKLGKDALILSIMTLITVLVWIGLDVYRAATKTTITQATQEQMMALEPRLSREIIEGLKTNLSFSEEELNLVPAPVVKEAESVEATESGQAATESAILD